VMQIFWAVSGIIHDHDKYQDCVETDDEYDSEVKKYRKNIKYGHHKTRNNKRTNPDILNIHIPLLSIVTYIGF
jgi:hypothetical protein